MNGSSGFKVGCILSSSSHNSVNFCLISKNNVSKLEILLSNYTKFIHISGFKVEQYLYKVVYFFGTPGIFMSVSKHF